ncbi:MAG: hypothetical protein WC082_07760 [Victivallales bacterium]
MNRILLTFVALLLCGGCVSGAIGTDDIASGVVAAITGLAANELAPDDWTDSEKAGLAAASAATSFIIGKSILGSAREGQEKAFQDGFKKGMAYGARRQFEIIQSMQKSNVSSNQVTYAIPAPTVPGINQEPHNVYLEVSE